MVAMITPCECPARSPWHLVSGMAVLAGSWTALVAVGHWLGLL